MDQVTYSELELADLVAYEVAEGQRAYDERREKAARRLAEIVGKARK